MRSYLGYPSTSGGLDDILISDRVSTPPETRHLYTERIVNLPHSYFVNDHRQLYPRPFASSPQRAEYGLPQDAVVLGNFGQLYKVEPGLFDVWTNIVKATPNATLWLLKFPKEAVKRLEVSVLLRLPCLTSAVDGVLSRPWQLSRSRRRRGGCARSRWC